MPHGQKTLYSISPTYTFQTGLTVDILKEIRTFDPNAVIDIDESINLVRPFRYPVEELSQPENTEYVYRDYQEDAIRKGLMGGRGLFEMATSAGKSLIIYGLIKNLWEIEGEQSRTLILVPNIQLVEQMYKDLLEYGCPTEDISRFSSKYRTCENTGIIISNRSWLNLHKDELPKDIDVLIVDEVHQLSKTSKVSKFVSQFKTHRRFGFTGTLPTFDPDLWHVKGLIGPLLAIVKAYELQEEGHIADTKIVTVRFEHRRKAPKAPSDITDPLERAKMRFPLEWRYIESCAETNEFMTNFMSSLDGNSILLYDHIEHGQNMLKILQDAGCTKRLSLIDGSTPVDYREEVRAQMEIHNDCLLLGNAKCVGTGISIKNIHNIGFGFAMGKSSAKVLQAIGRGLRLRGKFEKDHVKLIDFYHNYRYSREHFGTRLKMYKENYQLDKIIFKTIRVND
jgi:superfamily II DNA or RNA helicase